MCSSDLAADAGERGQFGGAAGEVAAMRADNLLRAAVQVARPGVVAEPGPVFDDAFDGRRRQGRDIGETGEKTLVVGDDRRHLGLLQHDLGQPDPVGVATALPGQVMAAGGLLPGDQALGKALFFRQISSRRGKREPG